MFQQGHARFLSQGSEQGSGAPNVLGPPTYVHIVSYNNQILHDDQTRWEENVFRIDHTPKPGQKLLCMLTRDLFAIAHLLVSCSVPPAATRWSVERRPEWKSVLSSPSWAVAEPTHASALISQRPFYGIIVLSQFKNNT